MTCPPCFTREMCASSAFSSVFAFGIWGGCALYRSVARDWISPVIAFSTLRGFGAVAVSVWNRLRVCVVRRSTRACTSFRWFSAYMLGVSVRGEMVYAITWAYMQSNRQRLSLSVPWVCQISNPFRLASVVRAFATVLNFSTSLPVMRGLQHAGGALEF